MSKTIPKPKSFRSHKNKRKISQGKVMRNINKNRKISPVKIKKRDPVVVNNQRVGIDLINQLMKKQRML